jgi:putative proteasome-type protease
MGSQLSELSRQLTARSLAGPRTPGRGASVTRQRRWSTTLRYMTFCVSAKVSSGLVGLADTRIVRGPEHSSKSKLTRFEHSSGPLFLMTSGLRSVRDKARTYFEQSMSDQTTGQLARMYEAANLFGDALRRVNSEDGDALRRDGFTLDLHAIIGGQLCADSEPVLLYVYPQGNWVEATADAPYHLIGRTSCGKPILDRLLSPAIPLGQALALAFLAFDATRASVTDVDFPIDIVVLRAGSGELSGHRFSREELRQAGAWWQETLRRALAEFPLDWAEPLLTQGDSSHD